MSCDFCDVEDSDFTSCQTCFAGVCYSCRSRCSTCMETICPDCDVNENDGICNECLEEEKENEKSNDENEKEEDEESDDDTDNA